MLPSSVYNMAAVSDDQQSAKIDENADEDDCEKERAIHDHFKEIDEVRKLIDSLKDVYSDLRRSEMSCERFTYIVDDYQEQPHLIDPYLEELLNKLLAIARTPSSPKLSREAFKYMYLLTKMRGFKVVTRLLPHEVSDMEPVLALIECQDSTDVEAWHTRYVLLIWLSIVCMIPFDLHRLDSNMQTGDGITKPPVMERILRISQMYLTVNDKCRDAAAYLMSKFLTRPDVKREYLPQMIDWNLKIISSSDVDSMKGLNCIVGSLSTLALLFKHGKREDLLPYASLVLSEVTSCSFMERNNSLLRKTTTKLIQRIGLVFLKYRVAVWRYQRGSRSLIDSLGGPGALKTVGIVGGILSSCNGHEGEEEEDFEVPEETEEVIGQLLGCLKDKDTIVRWSAAKGVGRVTGRLPKELADDVVGSVLELFSYQETDGAWHGGCLTLAELGRRGLLLPQRLKHVVPVVLKALLYDERRGSYSVGSHVRDAACYVCWAFARAYDPKEISPYVNKIANALVIVSLFDREVNVRRAAAAAFQENVGRQGTFPHGIDILTTVDYYAVGIRTHCYLDLSMFVAQFEEYTICLIDHLVQVKISHWDSPVRVLTAKALHRLTSVASDYVAKTVLSALLPMTTGIDLFQRHGSIIAIAEITHALFHMQQKINKQVESVLDPAILDGLKGIAMKIHSSKLLRGHGGELMRKAVCWLIEKLSASKLPFHEDPIIDLWQDLLEDCLSHNESEVQAVAVSAIPAFLSEYFTQEDGTANLEKQDLIIKNYLSQLSASLEQTRMGFSLALGALPLFMVKGHLMDIINGLIASTRIKNKEEKMAEARRDAVKALCSISKTVGVDKIGSPQHTICGSNISEIYAAFLAAITDYTMDSRGDIGSWVREAGMVAIGDLTEMVVKADSSLLQPDMVKQVFCRLVQQGCEKIDRIRMVAGQVFSKLLYLSPEVPHVPNRSDLLGTFPLEEIKNINWALPSETFPRFARLLYFPTYTHSMLLGFTVSVGGLTESLVKHSSASLLKYLKDLKEDEKALVFFAQALLDIFTKHQKVDRVSIPLLKMLDQLLGRQCFDALPEDFKETFLDKLLELVKQETARSADPQKLMAAADVYCGMLQFPDKTCTRCLVQLMVLLCHRYPRVRKTTANKLYEAVVTYDEVSPPESLDEIVTLLSETRWDENIAELRPVRDKLCDLFGVPKPVFKKRQED